jgi:hypothetical protein
MTKNELEQKTDAVIADTRAALQMVYDALNNGQQKKLLKDEAVAALFERYGVEV